MALSDNATDPDRVGAWLLGLFIFDSTLVAWAFLAPDLWFRVFHGAQYIDPQALLKRCGANWAAFAVIQFLAWRRWQREPSWLAVVAGVRWSDVFTDLTCALMAQSVTPLGWMTLPPMALANLALGAYFFKAHRRRGEQAGRGVSPRPGGA